MKHVEIYTDGSSRGNPGPGGYGTVIRYGAHARELAQGFQKTTNNRMEILAAVAGLEVLKEPCEVTVYSDSRYLVDAQTKGWVEGWRKRGWRKNTDVLSSSHSKTKDRVPASGKREKGCEGRRLVHDVCYFPAP
ncbi:hypothetical protein OAK74_01375 [bacterium]|nr:hypothetical protein [bacterium]